MILTIVIGIIVLSQLSTSDFRGNPLIEIAAAAENCQIDVLDIGIVSHNSCRRVINRKCDRESDGHLVVLIIKDFRSRIFNKRPLAASQKQRASQEYMIYFLHFRHNQANHNLIVKA